MTLQILKEYKVVSDLESVVISPTMLRLPTTHLFIASNKWDEAYIELCPEIPEGSLTNLHTVCTSLTVKLPEDCNEAVMRSLAELYPDKAGSIRKAFLTGRDLREVVPCI